MTSWNESQLGNNKNRRPKGERTIGFFLDELWEEHRCSQLSLHCFGFGLCLWYLMLRLNACRSWLQSYEQEGIGCVSNLIWPFKASLQLNDILLSDGKWISVISEWHESKIAGTPDYEVCLWGFNEPSMTFAEVWQTAKVSRISGEQAQRCSKWAFLTKRQQMQSIRMLCLVVQVHSAQ